MPDSKKLLALLAVITVVVCALPFSVAWPGGMQGVTLSQGATFIFSKPILLGVTLLIGFLSSLLMRDGVVLVPASFMLAFALAGMIALGLEAYPYFYLVMLGTLILLAVTFQLAGQKSHLILSLLTASAGFQFSVHIGTSPLAQQGALYFLVGELMTLGLALAISVNFGLIINDLLLRWLLPPAEDLVQPEL